MYFVSNDAVNVADVEEEKENPVAKKDDVSRLLLVATATARRIARILGTKTRRRESSFGARCGKNFGDVLAGVPRKICL